VHRVTSGKDFLCEQPGPIAAAQLFNAGDETTIAWRNQQSAGASFSGTFGFLAMNATVHPDSQRAARALFDALVDLEPSAQQQQLELLAPTQPELASYVRRLLEADRGVAAQVIDTQSVMSEAKISLALSMSSKVPETLGHFRVGRLLGAGGMSEVYLGTRLDGEAEQTVAIKIMPRAPFSESAMQTFRAERRMLAKLDHPAIARLIDIGLSADGVPYLIMEYVDGLPISDYFLSYGEVAIDSARDLRIKEIVNTYLKVCEAVAFAHGRLIVHRDLKPNNVMVSKSGDVKLLDFGIADTLDHALSNAGSNAAPLLAYTPGYAAPEQLEGAPSNIRMDIFALGVMLGELLEATGAGVLAEQTTLPLRQLELRAITQKASAALVNDRYASVDALAADLRAWLAHMPVSAYQSRASMYMARKFFTRHRWPVLVAMAALAAILLMSAMLLLSNSRLRQEKAVSAAALSAEKAARANADSVTSLLVDTFSAGNPDSGYGADLKVRDVLEIAQRRVLLDKAISEQTRKSMLFTLGETFGKLKLASMLDESVLGLQKLPLSVHDQVQLNLLRAQALRLQGHQTQAIQILNDLPTAMDTGQKQATFELHILALSDLGQFEKLIDIANPVVNALTDQEFLAQRDMILALTNAYLSSKEKVQSKKLLEKLLELARTNEDKQSEHAALPQLIRLAYTGGEHQKAATYLMRRQPLTLELFGLESVAHANDIMIASNLMPESSNKERLALLQQGLEILESKLGAESTPALKMLMNLSGAHWRLHDVVASQRARELLVARACKNESGISCLEAHKFLADLLIEISNLAAAALEVTKVDQVMSAMGYSLSDRTKELAPIQKRIKAAMEDR
jgi:tetratricopeptide (TPR) repeat protein